MLTYLQSIVLGGLQGVTELFPISSLGHSVILPALLGWNIDQQSDSFLVFLVVTHLATALVLLAFFASDWILIVKGIFRSLKNRRIDPSDTYERLAWLLVVATFPAGILGLLFEDQLRTLFASGRVAAAILILNGALLYGSELLKRRRHAKASAGDAAIASLSWGQAVGIGFMQSLALLPGFSRTGASLAGGLGAGLEHTSAARFAFLLATPIIFAAAVLKLPDLFFAQSYSLGPIFAGVAAAALGAYLSVKFLTRYFRTNTLTPFAIYCACAGAFAFLILSIR